MGMLFIISIVQCIFQVNQTYFYALPISTINKRSMGHIAHHRQQFKSLNKYDYIITLIKIGKKKLYEKLLVLHLKKFESPSTGDSLCQVWFKLAYWI